jgi:hypothetical protein
LEIYTDSLVNGFQDWSWGTRSFTNSSPVHTGSHSIQFSGSANQALCFEHSSFSTATYAAFSFWANGGSGGGQVVQVYAQVNGSNQTAMTLSALPAGSWTQFQVLLSSLNASNQTGVSQFVIRLTANGSTSPFYVDDVQLTAQPAPAQVHVSVNASQVIRVADCRWFGINTAIYDGYFDTPETSALLQEMGTMLLRFPGGSMSDTYHWPSNYIVGSSWEGWPTAFTNFAHIATNVGAQAIITANYGTGSAGEAAAWVRYSNLTNHYGFKYWEIGNEVYGSWEVDSNSPPNDPYTYAQRAQAYIQDMKAADPTIKVGVVVSPGEDSYANYTTHQALNPRTHISHFGWTPVLLATLKGLGVTPDFVIDHRYPEDTDSESDPLLLQSCGAWANDAGDLRQQLTDYLGSAATNVEILCTENNSNAGNQGKQSVSLVNALYYAGSLAELMQTELNSFAWWDLRNGTEYDGNMDPSLYGWRLYGDIGLIGDSSTRYPPFYAAKLMRDFVSPGDTIVKASSDYPLLSAYAAKGSNGSLSLLVLNKDSVATFNAQVSLAGITLAGDGTLVSYGIPQDNAAETGVGSPDLSETPFSGGATVFTNAFPPLSLTLWTFLPARMVVSPASQMAAAGSTTDFEVATLGLTNQLTLSVTGLPPGATAAFNPPSVSPSSPSTLTVASSDATPPGTYSLTIVGVSGKVTETAPATLIVQPQLQGWGNNDFGQAVAPPLTNGIAIAAGGFHSLALRADGTVLAWGDDWDGQCDVPSGLSNVVAIAAGQYHSLALRADGSVVAWGDNSASQTAIPPDATNVVAISAGDWHNLALLEDGGIVAWGDNSEGQTSVPLDATNVIAVAAGGEHSLALRSDGSVVAWGGNLDPFGNYSGQAQVPSSLGLVVAIAAGGFHSLALRADGTVAAWGCNSEGQASVPPGLSNVVAIAAGEMHSLALTGGSVIAWGQNDSGQATVAQDLSGVTAIAAGGYHSLAFVGHPTPGPLLGSSRCVGDSFSVSVPTLRGKDYFLQYKNHLSDTNWTWLSGMVGNGANRSLTDTAANAPSRFYLVRQQ